MQYFCPTCAGELFIDQSAPGRGTPCPLCRTPQWFLRSPDENGVVLTFLADGKHHTAGPGFSSVVVSSLQAASSVVVDLSRLHLASSNILDALVAIHERLSRSAVDWSFAGTTRGRRRRRKGGIGDVG